MSRKDRRAAAKGQGRGSATPSPELAQALVLHQAGRLGDAKMIYERILAGQPQNADALHPFVVVLTLQRAANDDQSHEKKIGGDQRPCGVHMNMADQNGAKRAAGGARERQTPEQPPVDIARERMRNA